MLALLLATEVSLDFALGAGAFASIAMGVIGYLHGFDSGVRDQERRSKGFARDEEDNEQPAVH